MFTSTDALAVLPYIGLAIMFGLGFIAGQQR